MCKIPYITLRKAAAEDIDLLVRLRIEYLTEDGGEISDGDIEALRGQLPRYFREHIADNTFVGMIAFAGAEAAGAETAGAVYLAISEKPANRSFITGITGTLLNVFTFPKFRGLGIATMAVRRVLEEAKALGVSSVELDATDAGKRLYEKLGFIAQSKYTHMSKRLM